MVSIRRRDRPYGGFEVNNKEFKRVENFNNLMAAYDELLQAIEERDKKIIEILGDSDKRLKMWIEKKRIKGRKKKFMDAYDDLLKALDKQANEFRKKELVI